MTRAAQRIRNEYREKPARRPELRDPHYLSSLSNSIIEINTAPADQDQRILVIEMNDAYLPQTSTSPARPLSKVRAFAQPIREAINLCLRNTSPASISRDAKVLGTFSALAHFSEWCWIEGFRNYSTLRVDDLKEFQEQLLGGYWPGALGLAERLDQYFSTATREQLEHLVSVRTTRYEQSLQVNYRALSKAIGSYMTNGSLPSFAYRDLEQRFAIGKALPRGRNWEKPVTASALHHVFKSINLLYEIHNDTLGLKFRPFPSPKRLAHSVAKPPARTPTVSVTDVEKLLAECFFWMFDIAPLAVEAMATVPDRRPSFAGNEKQRAMRLEQIAAHLPKHFNRLVTTAHFDLPNIAGSLAFGDDRESASDGTFVEVLRSIQEAARLVICATTAKRTSAVADRQSGLRLDSLRTVDEIFGIYVCEFRSVKKRRATRVAEEVSRLTAEALKVCTTINRAFHDMYPGTLGYDFDQTAPITSLPTPGPSGRTKPIHSRTDDKVRSRLFHDRLARTGASVKVAAGHVMRRMYALIYYRRYEMPILVALSNRLNHSNVEITKVYLTTEGGGSVNIEPLGAAQLDHATEIQKELDEAGTEYFAEKILAILRNEKSVGGFPKLVRRYLKWFYGAPKVEVAPDLETALKVAKELKHRGFSPISFAHGNCFATEKSIVKLAARCLDANDGQLHRERSSPALCRTCPHGLAGSTFLPSLRQRESAILTSLSEGALSGLLEDSLKRELAELRQTISILEA